MMEFVNGKDDIPYVKWKIIQSRSKPPTSHRTKREHRISNQSTYRPRPLDTHCLLLKDLGCSGICRNSGANRQPAAKWREDMMLKQPFYEAITPSITRFLPIPSLDLEVKTHILDV